MTHVNNQPISPGITLNVDHGTVRMTNKGSLSFTPNAGWQMEAIWLPAPEAVVEKSSALQWKATRMSAWHRTSAGL
ncbi:hypothetical protein [Aliamphritea spongicola]|nr:hypothetical protein [Aliamphritea spongicola]